jgi:APA family basic amino acid/polyamine antiporter
LRILAAHKFHNKLVVARAGEAHDVRATDPNRESRLDREFRIVRRALATAVTASCKSLATGPSEIFCEVFSMGLFSVKPVSRILEESGTGGENELRRTLGPASLVALGVGAVIGAGIFTITGIAAATKAGPALVLSFVVAAIGCIFAGICYSEFSSMIPIAGSAYTYSYATLGEFIAWIIGWDLVLEYCVGAATVSIGWSQTLVALLHNFGIDLPLKFAASPFQPVTLPDGTVAYGLINLPAVAIVLLVSFILIRGIRESASVNTVIVFLKVAVVIVFIAVGWAYIKPTNLTPFIPRNTTGEFGHFGYSGILAGAGVIFFAFIGFDAVSTAAQEAKRPSRDMPIGIIGSLVVCTILFILYAHVLTGVVSYKLLNVAAPLALALTYIPHPWLGNLMNLAVLFGLTSVMLVMLLGQSRVFYSMSRDGLLPPLFSQIHEKFRTPWRCNLLLMLFVSLFAAFAPIAIVGQMTSIGTLFAFVLVCSGILIMRRTHPEIPRPFRTPWVPVVPVLGIVVNILLMAGLGLSNWARLIIWLVIGLAIYFGYSRHHSHLREREEKAPQELGR